MNKDIPLFQNQPYQKYSPNVFDDSLSLYEQIIAFIEFLNQVIDNSNEVTEEILLIRKQFEEFKDVLDKSVEDFKEDIENRVLPENLEFILNQWIESGKIDTVLIEKIEDVEQNFTAQLDDKANENEVRKKDVLIGLNDVGADVLQALSETTGVPVNILSIPKPYSVTPKTTTFIPVVDVSKNRLNPHSVTSGGYKDVNGVVESSTDYGYSDYLEVNEGDTIVGHVVSKTSGNTGNLYFRFVTAYDSAKTPIGASSNSTGTESYVVPTGVSYIVLSSGSFTTTSLSNYNVHVERTTDGVRTTYQTYYDDVYRVKEEVLPKATTTTKGIVQIGQGLKTDTEGVLSIDEEISPTFVNDAFTEIRSNNKINPVEINSGYMQCTGVIYSSTSYGYTGVMRVTPGNIIVPSSISLVSGRIGLPGFRFVTAFDSEMNVLSSLGSDSAVSTYTVPEGVYFVVGSIGGLQNYGQTYKFMVEETTDGKNTTFEDYFTPYHRLNENNDATEYVEVFLPEEICIAVGRTIELYNRQVVFTGNMDNVHIQWVGNVGKSVKRKWSCEAVSGMVGNHDLRINVYDNRMNLIQTATTVVKIVEPTITTPVELTGIGDSLTNNKPWQPELRSLSNSMISYTGTRTGGMQTGQGHEGRSGATAGWYLDNSTYTYENNYDGSNPNTTGQENPFWNPTTSGFDFNYYKTTYGKNPTAIQLFLGTNGINLDPTNNANNIKAIVDGIRASDSAIPIFVVFTLYRGSQNGIGNQLSSDGYSAGSGVWKLEEDRKVFNLMVRIHEMLKNYANLHFVPVALTHDSENNFKDPSLTTPVNPRNNITEVQDKEATHPQLSGYLQIADIIYSTICAYL